MIDFIINCLLSTIKMFLTIILPLGIIGFFMHYCTDTLRNRISLKVGSCFFIYFTCVGTVVHELSHALMCIIFNHKINKISLFSPQADGVLGFVEHSYDRQNLYQRIGCFFIGVAPLVGGIVSIYFLSLLLLPENICYKFSQGYNPFLLFELICDPSFYLNIKSYIWLYLMFSIMLHTTLSPADLEGSKVGLMSLIAVLLMVSLVGSFIPSVESFLIEKIKTLILFFINPLLLAFFMLLIIYLILKKY